ncbi:Foldase protein PrsA [bioreactor metagenome]|uniref:Periplasmic chaperone PpiD n=1 Tax=bioreactor metagenome TaxID=1076179 RepID=A0A644YDX9_9ZZZZ
MATIGKIRKHSGLLVAIIGVALALFVLSDFMTKGRGNRSVEPLAVVFGEKIKYQDFTAKVEERKAQYMMQYGQDLQFSASDNFQISNEVFDKMVEDLILQEEYDKLGLAVSDAELGELFTGKFVHPLIKQLFTNPETGVFDPNQVAMYIESLDERSPEEQQNWHMYENMIIEERTKTKYVTLVSKGYYIPKAFIERDNIDRNKKYVTTYTGLRFASISDSTITVSDEDMKKYYDEHKFDFVYDEPIASLDFVIFNVKPSATDHKYMKEKVDTIYSHFLTTADADMPAFINSSSDIDFVWDSSYLRREVLPVKADTLFGAKIGSFVAPYMDNNIYFMHKLLDRKMIPDSLKAAHILISYQGAMKADSGVTRTKEEAKHVADSLLSVVRGKDSTFFSQVAIANSNDPSVKQNAGYFDWFPEGAMVPEFNKACVEGANGSYTVVETAYGYHIIKVIDKTKPISKVKIATIRRTVEPSTVTSDSIYNLANVFAAESQTQEAFDKNILDKGYNINVAEKVRVTDYTINGINEGREVVRWAYNEETVPGQVSNVFSLDGETKYVIAVLKTKAEKGQAEFEQVKAFIEPFAKKEKKAQMLLEKMNSALNGVNSVDALAKKLNTEVDTFDVTFATYSLPGFGNEPEIVGNITASQKGQMSKALKGEMGIFVYTVLDVVEAQPADLNAIVSQKMQFFQSKVNYELFKALQKKADIEDNRILFY